MPTQEEIYTKVSATLVEALNVDEDDIKPPPRCKATSAPSRSTSWTSSSGWSASSASRSRAANCSPNRSSRATRTSSRTARSRTRACDELRDRMPFADLSEFEKNPEMSHLSDLFTVDLITRYIQGKLQQQ